MPRVDWQKQERFVSKSLQAWWSQLEPECQFVRTPRSGGWAHAEEFKARGDVMVGPRTLRFPFTVEVKYRRNWTMANLVAGRASPVWGWWREAVVEAEDEKREPMLVFKKRHRPWFVLLRQGYVLGMLDGYIQPEVAWSVEQLADLNVQPQPVLFPFNSILAVPPEVFALPAPNG